jgi:cell division protein FtsZ
MQQADAGTATLREYVDSLIVIPNERLKQVSENRITLANAFETADEVLRRGVQSVSDLVNVPGFVNLDFADVTAIMKDAGYAHMGVGTGRGQDKAVIAATTAISSPLLETSIAGATGVLVSITAAPDIGLEEVDLASTMIAKEAHPDANIIWGAAFDPSLEDEMRVTIIATGFDKTEKKPIVEPIVAEPILDEVPQAEPEKAPTPSEAPRSVSESVDAAPLSDTELDDILAILRKRK